MITWLDFVKNSLTFFEIATLKSEIGMLVHIGVSLRPLLIMTEVPDIQKLDMSACYHMMCHFLPICQEARVFMYVCVCLCVPTERMRSWSTSRLPKTWRCTE